MCSRVALPGLGWSTGALAASSMDTSSKWLFWQAMYSGVVPSGLAWSIAAPAASSMDVTSKWPFWQTMYSGVVPLSFAWSHSCTGSQQCRSQLQVAFVAGNVKWGGAIGPRLVHSRARSQQHGRHLQAAVLEGSVQRSDVRFS